LGQTQHGALFAYPVSHMIVDCGGRSPSLRPSHALHPCKSASDVLIPVRCISFNAIKTDKFRRSMSCQRPLALNNSDNSTHRL
jgi:hypothetical protein